MLNIYGDIHGNADALRQLLSDDGFDRFLGDIVCKGPDSVGAMDIVSSRVEQKKADLVLGNYEKLMYAWFNGDVTDSFYRPYMLPLEEEIKQAGRNGSRILDKFMTVIENSHPWIVEGDNIFVHAIWQDRFLKYGVKPQFKDLDTKEARDFFGIACTGHRNYSEDDNYEVNKIDWSWLDLLGPEKRVYIGHSSVPKITQVNGKNKAIAFMLDTGSGKGGILTCYRIY